MLSSPSTNPVNVAVPIVLTAAPQFGAESIPTRTLKVLHVINGEHFSGAERVQQLLGKCLPEFGVLPTFACVKPGKFPGLCGLAENQVLQTPMRGRMDLRIVRELSRIVGSESFEVLHAHTPRTALVTSMVSMRTRVPWCYHVHSPTSRDSTRGLVNRINYWIERYSIGSCTQLLTVSKSLRREMLRLGVSRSRLTVVPNGVPIIEPIVPSQRLDSNRWRLGLVALMRPRKGVEIALEAMSLLNQRGGSQLELELIGGFETEAYKRHILAMIDQLKLTNCVRLTGFTNDIATAIRRLDTLVLPSLFGEGMPMVVLEALAAAVPVVATKVEGTPEVIRHSVEGLLAEPRSATSLADQINRLTSNRSAWAEMSAQAMARHRQHYTASLMARKVANVYRSILGN
jgi:glycosyltransferase involved in cell wall biosynthesis